MSKMRGISCKKHSNLARSSPFPPIHHNESIWHKHRGQNRGIWTTTLKSEPRAVASQAIASGEVLTKQLASFWTASMAMNQTNSCARLSNTLSVWLLLLRENFFVASRRSTSHLTELSIMPNSRRSKILQQAATQT